MTREELLKIRPTYYFEMRGDNLLARTIDYDFDGYPIKPNTLYVCRWYDRWKIWFIEPKHGEKRLKAIPKIVGFKKKR